MAETAASAPLSKRLASAHGLNWAFDNRYRWAWYFWPQAVAVLAAVWLLAGMPDVIPHGEWSKPAETAGAQMDSLRDSAKTDTGARERLKRLADAGDPFAQFSYGTLFDPVFKLTDFPDINTALEWYLKAANQGHTNAQLAYGWRYFYGEAGLKVDYDKGFPWLLKAAQQGALLAQRAVGEAYRDGHGTTADLATSLKWFRAAADEGDAYSQEEIGDAYAEGKPGYDKNMTEAIAWYRKAAEQNGLRTAQARHHLFARPGRRRNGPRRCLHLLRQSAADGPDKVAQYYLGTMYQQGIFVKEDLAAAIGWYKKSADQGYADAKNAMGLAYLNGVGVAKDKDTAKAWFEKAAANGNEEAAKSLKSLGAAVPQRNEVCPTPNRRPGAVRD